MEWVCVFQHKQDGDDRADYWDVYYTSDGTDPVPGVDSPESEAMKTYPVASPLHMKLGPFDHGEEIRVIVRCRRSSDSADDGNSTVYTHTMTTQENYPLWGGGFGT